MSDLQTLLVVDFIRLLISDTKKLRNKGMLSPLEANKMYFVIIELECNLKGIKF